MISVEKFINVLDEQLLYPLLIHSWCFDPRYSTDVQNFAPPDSQLNYDDERGPGRTSGICNWWHEEPLNIDDLEKLKYRELYKLPDRSSCEYYVAPGPPTQEGIFNTMYDVNFHLFANSEKSTLKKSFLKDWRVYDWYFFFHGFAALDWYRDYKYLNYNSNNISKVFICLNHIIKNNRSYRLNLLSHIKKNNLHLRGFISAPLLTKNTIKEEVFDPNTKLSTDAKKHIITNLFQTASPILLDQVNYNQTSADIISPMYQSRSLWNVVTETVFYEDKLHLTEKIFKPIVTKRPFILVGGHGNLAYLKSYGFKTFDRWIDESYDEEPDPDIRIFKIANELKKLCAMSQRDILTMYYEMSQVLEYNHNHFFYDFKKIIVNELVDNFEVCTKQYNLGRSDIDRHRLPVEKIDFEQVKKFLLR